MSAKIPTQTALASNQTLCRVIEQYITEEYEKRKGEGLDEVRNWALDRSEWPDLGRCRTIPGKGTQVRTDCETLWSDCG
jgi:hypothetical protein